MSIVDYLTRKPNGEPSQELKLDKKLVVNFIESFHKALDCLSTRLNDTRELERNELIIEKTKAKRSINNQNTSSLSCYGNRSGQN